VDSGGAKGDVYIGIEQAAASPADLSLK